MVFHDISERQRLLREISRRNEELAEADRRKDEFLAMLGHELRNPLSAMVNALAVQRALPATPASRERAALVLDRQLAIVGRLVDDLLDVARISRGAVELRREPFDLRLAVERAAETARPAFHARELTVAVHQSAEALLVDADPVRIEQVIANLVSNAIKYTPRGGTVDLVTAAGDAEAVVTVRDTGVGIDGALLSRIFDLFVQGERSLHRPEGGLGIGLTLARTLVELHGGRLEARSAGPGHGSTFTVRLPRLVGGPASPSAATSSPEGRRIRILVVDDHPDSAEMLGTLLRSIGHAVEIAHDGPGAIAAATSFGPDLVLLDIGLPGMDGYAVARALRAMPGLATVTIAALTGYGQPQDRARGREAGFDFHLVKPVAPQQLEDVVARVR